MPISVYIADALNPAPEYSCSKDPEELIRLFLGAKKCSDKRRCGRKIHATRPRGAFQRTTKPYQPMVFTSASDRFELRPIRYAAYQKVLHHPSWARKRSLVRRETGSNYVHKHAPVQVSGHFYYYLFIIILPHTMNYK